MPLFPSRGVSDGYPRGRLRGQGLCGLSRWVTLGSSPPHTVYASLISNPSNHLLGQLPFCSLEYLLLKLSATL